MSGSAIIKSIQEKIDRLIADNQRLRVDYDKVADQRDRLKADNRDLAEQIARLESRIAVLELKDSLAGDSDNAKVARARVNRLMREVDKCIALLNR